MSRASRIATGIHEIVCGTIVDPSPNFLEYISTIRNMQRGDLVATVDWNPRRAFPPLQVTSSKLTAVRSYFSCAIAWTPNGQGKPVSD
jgi:hypothetical protein